MNLLILLCNQNLSFFFLVLHSHLFPPLFTSLPIAVTHLLMVTLSHALIRLSSDKNVVLLCIHQFNLAFGDGFLDESFIFLSHPFASYSVL
jgi:hypothetical protein